MKSLSALLKAARDAPPETRIGFRDPIATYGVEAITKISPWLADPRLGAFAARVIAAVGRDGHAPEALAAFTGGLETAGSDAVRRDVEAGIAEFAPPRRRRAVSGRTGYDILEAETELRGRPAVRYRIETHKERGHFNVPRAVMDQLGIETDGAVDLDIHRSSTGGLVYSGRMGIGSGTEIYPTIDDASAAELRALGPYESIDVTVSRDDSGSEATSTSV
jgi:hypothetical protein